LAVALLYQTRNRPVARNLLNLLEDTMADRIERDLLLPVSPAEAWQALTDPALLAEWLADEVVLDLRPGGDATFRTDGQLRTGWVEEVTPPERLAFWWSDAGQPATRVELTLEPADGGAARLRVVECRPLEILDLVGIPLPGAGGGTFGPALAGAAR
jgi:hypothetical protein